MRDSASSNGAVVRRRSERQKTTMARSGILSKMRITKSSNQSIMSTKNVLTNMKVTVKFYSMIMTKLVSSAREGITKNS